VYDSKNEAHEFVADGKEDALEKAVRFFGVDADALTVKVYESDEVSGLGGRTLIVAALRDRKPPSEGRGPRERGERNDRGDRGERSDRGNRGERGERGGRGGRNERGGRGERGGREERGGRDRDPSERAAQPAARSTEPSVGKANGPLSEAGTFLLGLIERLDTGPFEISESSDGELVAYEIRGEAASSLAGGDGRPVDALQVIVNQVAMRLEDEPKRIVLDVEGNADAREGFLEQLAARVVRRAQDGGRAIALDPMNGRDRRIIHIAVREHDGMATMSIGEGRYRQVVVVPEGAPEYEDAVKQSQAAAGAD